MPRLNYIRHMPSLKARYGAILSRCGGQSAAARIPMAAPYAARQARAANEITSMFQEPPRKVAVVVTSRRDADPAVSSVRLMFPDAAPVTCPIGLPKQDALAAVRAWNDAETGCLAVSAAASGSWGIEYGTADAVLLYGLRNPPFGSLLPYAVDMTVLDFVPDDFGSEALRERDGLLLSVFPSTMVTDLCSDALAYLERAEAAVRPSAPVWTKAENDALRVAVESLARISPDKSLDNVLEQVFLNDMEPPGLLSAAVRNRVPWTQAEDDVMVQYFRDEFDAVSERLPGRTAEACRARAKKLGLVEARSRRASNGHGWRDDENQILTKFYPLEGPRCAARLPGRTQSAVRHQANKLHLFCKPNAQDRDASRTTWTEAQDETLAAYGPVEGVAVYRRIPGKSPGAVRARALRIGVALAPARRKADGQEMKRQESED